MARDCSTEYGCGTTLAASAAVQFAELWHLLLDTRRIVERWLARVHPRLEQLPPAKNPDFLGPPDQTCPRASAEVLARAAVVGRREGLYDDVQRGRAAGQSLRRINRETGLARARVRRNAFAERFPRLGRRGLGRSHLDPRLNHLHARYAEGRGNAIQLWRELRAVGFPGTVKQIRRWLSKRRTQLARTTAARYRTWLSSTMTSLRRSLRCPRRRSRPEISCTSPRTSTPTLRRWSRVPG